MDADGQNQTRLTNNPFTDAYPTFSPDGKKIAFTSNRDGGNYEVYVMDADGQNQTNISNKNNADFEPDWGVAVQDKPQCTITGTEGADTLNGTPGNDVICGLGGSDTINGAGGDDTIHGGAGADVATGGAGKDVLLGGEGDDFLDVQDRVGGNDSVDGQAGGGDHCSVDRGDAKANCEWGN
jgi:Ca2+-binding RTX toxin-like protein